MKDLSTKIKDIPTASGVYIMLDEYQQILYIGKAKNLRNRVRQYFQTNATQSEKNMILVDKIADFRYIITNTELEALILENNLIKEHKPFYNILLKDDKSYPYIKINLKQPYPKIEIVRKLKPDGSKYFGPYMLGLSARTILDLLHSIYPIRSCQGRIDLPRKGRRECLNYHIGRCKAPCVGKISQEEYMADIHKVIDFLNGNDREAQALLEKKMKEAAEKQEFELAMTYRDSLQVLDKVARKQIITLPRDFNLDIYGYANNGMYGTINYMVVRGGKVVGAENFPINEAGEDGEILSSYIMQFYEKSPIVADEILVPMELPFQAELSDYLTSLKGSRVHVYNPRGGIKLQLVDMSYDNASNHLANTVYKIATKEALTLLSVQQLKDELDLRVPPKRIECYDISNIGGSEKVASMVVFINGEPAREMYRRFKIKSVKGADDYASMREVISRRAVRFDSQDISFSEYPDLIVIDGGKGQLSSAYEIIKNYNIDIISLAERDEEIFIPDKKQPIILAKDSFPLMLLQRVRDESHRFANAYHRILRKASQTKSILKNIAGVGDKRAKTLLTHFKKIENIKNASIDEIMQLEGFGEANARAVKKYFEDNSIENEI